eukprot:COSAG02_NODE_59641_length_273_cov_1.505747_1_plen_59_part_01
MRVRCRACECSRGLFVRVYSFAICPTRFVALRCLTGGLRARARVHAIAIDRAYMYSRSY